MDISNLRSEARLVQSMTEIAVESWKFSRLFARLLQKLDAGEANRYVNQLRYYLKSLDSNLESAGLRLVDFEGHPYDPGMAATALNLSDFGQLNQISRSSNCEFPFNRKRGDVSRRIQP